MVEMGTDRDPPRLLALHRPGAPAVRAGQPVRGRDARLLPRASTRSSAGCSRFADDDTAVLVVSDHGAKRIDGGICVNEWLRREGYLDAGEEPAEPLAAHARHDRLVAHGRLGRGRLLLPPLPERRGPRAGGHRRAGGLRARPQRAEGEARGARRRAGARDRHGRAPAGGALPDAERDRRPTSWSTSATSTGGASARSARAPSTSSRTTPAPDDANHAHEGLYVLVADGVEPGRGESGACSTSRRRSSACSASPCRRRWKARASLEVASEVPRHEADPLRPPERVDAQPDQLPDHGAGALVRGRDLRARALVDIGCGSKPWRTAFAPHVTEHVGVDLVDSKRAPGSVDVIAGAYEIRSRTAARTRFSCPSSSSTSSSRRAPGGGAPPARARRAPDHDRAVLLAPARAAARLLPVHAGRARSSWRRRASRSWSRPLSGVGRRSRSSSRMRCGAIGAGRSGSS